MRKRLIMKGRRLYSYILCAVSVKLGAKAQHLTDQHLETRRLFHHDIIQEITQAITVTTEQGLT
jgi:hypothetical protein